MSFWVWPTRIFRKVKAASKFGGLDFFPLIFFSAEIFSQKN